MIGIVACVNFTLQGMHRADLAWHAVSHSKVLDFSYALACLMVLLSAKYYSKIQVSPCSGFAEVIRHAAAKSTLISPSLTPSKIYIPSQVQLK